MRKTTYWLLGVLVLAGGIAYLAYPRYMPHTRPVHAPPAAWRETAPGIAVYHTLYRVEAVEVPIVAVRADLARCVVRAIDAHHGVDGVGAMAVDVCPKVGAVINASYFAEDLTPIGVLVTDGKRITPFHTTGAWGLFLVRQGRPELLPCTGNLPEGVTQAVQCKPRLLINGAIPKFKRQGAARRSAVALDAHGRLLFVASDSLLTLEDWAACLRDVFGCVDALNLDGGPSTQLAVRGKVQADITGGWDVPVFLTVTPRGL